MANILWVFKQSKNSFPKGCKILCVRQYWKITFLTVCWQTECKFVESVFICTRNGSTFTLDYMWQVDCLIHRYEAPPVDMFHNQYCENLRNINGVKVPAQWMTILWLGNVLPNHKQTYWYKSSSELSGHFSYFSTMLFPLSKTRTNMPLANLLSTTGCYSNQLDSPASTVVSNNSVQRYFWLQVCIIRKLVQQESFKPKFFL